jgi:aminoglycoside phosphotransferase (APT) family kinase protein
MAEGDRLSGHRAVQQRDPVLAGRYYERCAREVRFYREVGRAGRAPVPHLFHAAEDGTTRRVVLVLEDLSAGRPGDVLQGCSVDEAAAVVDVLAPFHARWWGERAPADAFPRWGTDADERQERYEERAGVFLERYAETLSPDVRSIVERLRSRLGSLVAALANRPQTLVHADLHLDNLIFGRSGPRPSVAVLDWQTAVIGPPAVDVAFFLCDSLSITDRRRAEGSLCDHYVERLEANGVASYSVDDLQRDSRAALLLLLAGTIGWLASVDRADLVGRERALQDAAIGDGRLLAALRDHDVAVLLGD